MKNTYLTSFIIAIFLSVPCFGQAGQKKPERTMEDRINMTMASAGKDGKLEYVKIFVKNNPEFWKLVDKDGSSLTHAAAGFGRLEILDFLLNNDLKGESLRLRNREGLRPLGMARKYHKDDTIALLEKKYKALGIATEAQSVEQASSSTSSSSSSAASSRPEAKTDFSTRDLFLKSIGVIQSNKTEDVQLSQLQANVFQNPDIVFEQDDVGRTLLSVAAQYGKPQLVHFLLEKKSEPNVADKKRSTPLAKAIANLRNPANAEKKSEYKTIIKELMGKGAQVFAQVYVMYKPNRAHLRKLAKIAQQEVVQPNSHLVSSIDADAMHATIVYISVPIKYVMKEGQDYTDHAEALLHQVHEVVAASTIGKTIGSFEVTPRPTFKPFGSHLGLEYSVPFDDYKKAVGKLYRGMLSQLPKGSVQTYPGIEYPHISLAKALPTVSDAQLKEKVRGGYVSAFLSMSSPFIGEDVQIEVSVRIPSVDSPGYKEFSSKIS